MDKQLQAKWLVRWLESRAKDINSSANQSLQLLS